MRMIKKIQTPNLKYNNRPPFTPLPPKIIITKHKKSKYLRKIKIYRNKIKIETPTKMKERSFSALNTVK